MKCAASLCTLNRRCKAKAPSSNTVVSLPTYQVLLLSLGTGRSNGLRRGLGRQGVVLAALSRCMEQHNAWVSSVCHHHVALRSTPNQLRGGSPIRKMCCSVVFTLRYNFVVSPQQRRRVRFRPGRKRNVSRLLPLRSVGAQVESPRRAVRGQLWRQKGMVPARVSIVPQLSSPTKALCAPPSSVHIPLPAPPLNVSSARLTSRTFR